MKKQTKKLIAPIVITVLVVSYFLIYIIGALFIREIPLIINVLLIIIPVCLAIVSAFMLIERIKEIKDGEEDDLSKY